MESPSLRRPVRAALLGAAALALAGCEAGQMGFSGRDAEWARARGPFSVVSASSNRAVVSAQGNRIAVEPPPGFCLAEDSIETSERGAFLLIGDCVLAEAPSGATPGGDGGLDLPAGMPGVMTVSISGDPRLSAGGLSDLEAWLGTAEGRALLGRGGDGSQVSIVETRRQGDTLYVLVEDRLADAVPVFAPRFWRAFVEVNGRLAIATVSGFRDVPMDEDQMLRHLGDQVRHLQMANAVPMDEAPVQVAAAPRRQFFEETGSGDEAAVEIEVVDASAQGLPARPAPSDPAWAALQDSAEGTALAVETAKPAAVVLAEAPVVMAADDRAALVGPDTGDAPAGASPAEAAWAAVLAGAADGAGPSGETGDADRVLLAETPAATAGVDEATDFVAQDGVPMPALRAEDVAHGGARQQSLAADGAPVMAGPADQAQGAATQGGAPTPPSRRVAGAGGWAGLQDAGTVTNVPGAPAPVDPTARSTPDAGDALEEDPAPAPRPMVVAATQAGTQGLWPMPQARRGDPAAGGVEALGDVPRPAPRLVDPAGEAAPQSTAAGVPLPPRRTR